MTGTIISLISIVVAAFALVFSIITYLANRQQNRKELAYRMLYDLNSIVIDHIQVSELEQPNPTPVQAAYASMVWNFIESVFNLDLHNDGFLKPSIDQFVESHGSWYKHNRNLYGSCFQEYIKKTYPSL